MATGNYVSFVNELCQKKKLGCVFEKQSDVGLPHCRNFTMRLKIHGTDPKIYLEYFGEGKSIKEAKNEAAKKLVDVDVESELKKKVLESNSNFTSSSNSVAGINQMNELTKELDYMTLTYDHKDKILEAWRFAKENRLSMRFDFQRAKRGKTEVKFKLGNIFTKGREGKGSNDLEAIYDSVKDIDFDHLSVVGNDDYQEESSDGEGSHKVSQLYEYHQQLNKPLEFNCIFSSGSTQPVIYIHKCQMGDAITYGIGKNKKSSKNQSARMMLKKLNEDVDVETVMTTMTGMSRMCAEKIEEKIQEILRSNSNAVSILEEIDRVRERTLKFTEQDQQVGVQSQFTCECKLLLSTDLKVRKEDLEKNSIRKEGYVFLRTNAKSTKKKTAKMDAAERMVNMLRGHGAYTNEEVEQNKELKEFHEKTFAKTKDIIDRESVGQYFDVLDNIIDYAVDYLKDKPKYDPDYDFLSEMLELEYKYRDVIEITIRLSNEIYEKYNNVDHLDPYVTCKIQFKCGIIISALCKSLDEMESKNEAAFIILQKLSKISKESLY